MAADEVYNIYRRTKDEMPADMVEIEEAEEGGVIFKNLRNPLKIHAGKCAAASGTVVPGQIVQDTAIRRKYPQEITAFPCKSEHECENKTYPANDIKRKI